MPDRIFRDHAKIEPDAGRLFVQATWLLMLRWVAVAGQLLAVSAATIILGDQIAIGRLLALIAATAITNVAFALWLGWMRSRPDFSGDQSLRRFLGAVMVVDVLLLTALLYYSGGTSNPFTVFFLMNLALAAVLLPSRWAWGLTLAALACIVGLTFNHHPLPVLEAPAPLARRLGEVTVGRAGLLAAYATCALVVTYFITRVSFELQRREADLRVAEQRRARSSRLEALATLAAGAGHEMASPLSTIAVVANELARHLEGTNVPATVLEDVSLIRSELDHCRSILDRMASGNAGQAVGEEIAPLTIESIVSQTLDGLRHPENVRVRIPPALARQQLMAPLQGLCQAIRGVIQNALDVTPPDQTVELRVELQGEEVVILVVDQGPGMSAEVAARAGEPFFTTKEPGKGMGLGLFLTQNVLDRLGGQLRLHAILGKGCRAEIRLPRPADSGGG